MLDIEFDDRRIVNVTFIQKLRIDVAEVSQLSGMKPQRDNSETRRFSSALKHAFDILGPVSQQRLYECLNTKYDINVNEATEADISVIQHAISEIFGDAAVRLLMKQIYAALNRSDSYT